jgi:hypothetical protein
MNLVHPVIIKETQSKLLSALVITRRCFDTRRDRQRYNEESTHFGSVFCYFAPKYIIIISTLVVTRRELQERVRLIEPAIQMQLTASILN